MVGAPSKCENNTNFFHHIFLAHHIFDALNPFRWIMVVLCLFPFFYGGPIALISVELSAAMPFDGGAVSDLLACHSSYDA